MAISPCDCEPIVRLSSSVFIPFAACGGLICVVPSPAVAQVTGNASLTTDYVWRGSSQTRARPAVQAGVKYAHASGLYASAWGSNVRFEPDSGATGEFDVALGWSGELSPEWALDISYLRYQYPSTRVDLNWGEINAVVTWRNRYWFALGHSADAMASRTTGVYMLAGVRQPLADKWRIEGTLAYYRLDHTYAESYSHGSFGVVWGFKAAFEARVTLHGADAAATRLFPRMAGTRAELAVQASF